MAFPAMHTWTWRPETCVSVRQIEFLSVLDKGSSSILFVLLLCKTEVTHSFLFLRLEFKCLVSHIGKPAFTKIFSWIRMPMESWEVSIFQLQLKHSEIRKLAHYLLAKNEVPCLHIQELAKLIRNDIIAWWEV